LSGLVVLGGCRHDERTTDHAVRSLSAGRSLRWHGHHQPDPWGRSRDDDGPYAQALERDVARRADDHPGAGL